MGKAAICNADQILAGEGYVYAGLLSSEKERACSTQFLTVNTAGIDRPRFKNQAVDRPDGMVDFQLIYLASGQGWCSAANCGNPRPFRAGDFIVFAPGLPQHYGYTAGKAEAFWVHFSGSGAAKLLAQLQITPGKIYSVSGAFNASMFEKMVEIMLLHSAFAEVQAAGCLTVLLSQLAAAVQALPARQHSAEFLKIKPAIEFLKLHYARDTENKALAARCNLSVSRFCHLFTACVGLSPVQYRLSLRMRCACQLLRETNCSVGTIAQSVGYEDPLYFSRVFKAQTGLSPQKYRQKACAAGSTHSLMLKHC